MVKRLQRRWLPLTLLLLGMFLHSVSAAVADGLPQLGDAEREQHVVVLRIDGTVDLGLSAVVRRALRESEAGAAALILVIDTHGGRLDAAVQIRDALLETDVPVIAFVHHRAISAGALIAYAADTMVFSPGASMGAATPITVEGGVAGAVDEKMTSYMRAEMRSTAEFHHRRADLAEAMVDAAVVIEGLEGAETLLTLTTDDATRLGVADGVAADLDALIDQLGLGAAERRTVESGWAEKLARFLTDPTVSGILMSLGMLGLMVELYTPGFGLTGVVGVSLLAAFFGGHMIAELAGWEEALMLLVGVVLLGVELFVTPGFGVVGIAGILTIIASLALSLVDGGVQPAWEAGLLGDAVSRVLASLAITIVALCALIALVPSRALPNWLVLRTRLSTPAPGAADPLSPSSPSAGSTWPKTGQCGVALTDLRLSGKAEINGQVVDVVSQLEYIDAGVAVEVIQIEGARVVVRRLPSSVQSQT